MDDSLGRRLGEIEKRLSQIEQSIAAIRPGLTSPLEVTHVPVAEPPIAYLVDRTKALLTDVPPIATRVELPAGAGTAEASPPPGEPAAVPGTKIDENTDSVPQVPEVPPIETIAAAGAIASPRAVPPPLPPPASPLQYQRATAVALPARPTLEQTVGLKWAGWIGAVVLVIGAALGFKFAYDQGWLGGFPPAARIGLLVMVGVGLLGAGEWVFRRINRMSAGGFYGAGTAVLFLASYAGHSWYGLYLQPTAVALMGASAMAGVLVAARADMVSVAVLAIIGGNIGPLVLGSERPALVPFFLYLLLMQCMALGLCARRRGRKWWPLRGLTLATTTLWMLAIGLNIFGDDVLTAAAIALVFAVLFQAELCFSTVRQARVRQLDSWQPTAGPAFSLLVTMDLALNWLVFMEDHRSKAVQGVAILSLAAAAAAAGFALKPRSSMAAGDLAPKPRPLNRIALSLRVQSIILGVLSIPVALSGPSVLFAWMLLAIGLAILAAATGRRLAMIGAVLTWALATAVWWAWSADDPGAQHVWATIVGQSLEARLVLAACLAATGHLLAAAERQLHVRSVAPEAINPVPRILIDIAAMAVLATALFVFATPNFATLAAIAYAVLLFLLSFAPGFASLAPSAIALLGAAGVKWAVLDVLQPEFGRSPVLPQRMLFNSQVAIGSILATSVGVMGFVQSRREINIADPAAARRSAMSLAGIFAAVMVIFAFTLTIEIDRYWRIATAAGTSSAWPGSASRDLLWTILWSAAAAVWFGACRLSRRNESVWVDVIRVTLTLAIAATAKFILLDVVAASLDHAAADVAVVFNLQALAGACVLALLVATLTAARGTAAAWFAQRCGLIAPLLLLVIGSAEIDRYATHQTAGPTWIVRQVGWSIYWSALAVAMLIVGFVRHVKTVRVAALSLLGVTLAKVTLVDLSTAGSGWRILSFIGLGLLLMATSILYGRFSHRVVQ